MSAVSTSSPIPRTQAVMESVRRAWHSPTLTTWASFGVRALSLAIVLPWALRRFSPPEALVWQLIVTIYSVHLMLDLGLTTTFSRLFAYARGGAVRFDRQEFAAQGANASAAPNWAGAAALWATQLRLFTFLSVGAALAMATLGTWFLWTPIRQLPHPELGWLAWGVTILGSPAVFRTMAYSSWLLGMNAVSELRRTEALFALGGIVTTLLVLASGGRLLGIVLASQTWVWLNLLRSRWLARRVAEGRMCTFGQSTLDPEVWRSLWPLAWRSGVGVLLGGGLVQASGLLASKLAGPGQAAVAASFLVALRLATALIQFSNAPFGSKLPVLATLRAQNRREEFLALTRRGMLLAHWILVLGAVVGAVGMPLLLSLTGSQTPFVTPSVWWLLCASFLFERFGAANLQVYSTSNHIVWHLASGGSALVIILAGCILIPIFGLPGLPAAMLAGNLLFYAPFTSWLMYRDLKVHPLAWERGLFLPPLFAFLLVAALHLALH